MTLNVLTSFLFLIFDFDFTNFSSKPCKVQLLIVILSFGFLDFWTHTLIFEDQLIENDCSA